MIRFDSFELIISSGSRVSELQNCRTAERAFEESSPKSTDEKITDFFYS